MEEKKLRAVFYARVSTEEEEQLNAIEKQIEENIDVIHDKGWILVDRYIDKGITGTQAKKRNEYIRLLDDIKKDKFDIIVVKDQSRLQRNTMDWYIFLHEITQNQKRLYFYLENIFFNPNDKFIYGIKAMMAEEYSRDLSKKGNAAKRRRQEKGKPIITNRTWGFKNVNGEILIDEEEAKLVTRIYKLFADGLGGRVVARILHDDGIRNRNGKTLSENTIREIVKNPLYKGIAVMNKEHFDFETKKIIKNPESEWIYREGIVPRIVSDDLWEKANAQINSRKTVDRTHNVGINKGNTLLSSKIICGECESKYWRNKRTQGIYWYCSEGARSGKVREKTGMKCVSLNLKEDEILSVIEHLGNQLIAKEKKEEVLSKAIRKIYAGLTDSYSGENVEDIQAQKEKLNKRKDTLMDLLLDGTITKTDYSSKVNDISEQMAALSEKEIRVQEKKEENGELLERLNQVKALFENKTEKGIEVPLMCSHIEQIKVYEKRLDVYLDFLKGLDFLSIDYDKGNRKGGQSVYDMPIWVGGILPGRR
ncbi:MAG: recombinase family protein [Clostridiales bacterium]|nr:recombinase family protein [Clostridiales bacterium]